MTFQLRRRQPKAIETTVTVTVRVPKAYWPPLLKALNAQLPPPERLAAGRRACRLPKFDGPAAIAWLETHRAGGAASWLSCHLHHVPAGVRPHLTAWIFQSR